MAYTPKIAAKTNRKTAISMRNAQLQREPAGRCTLGGSGAARAVERVRSGTERQASVRVSLPVAAS